jgi:flagellar basal-body rod protein FlgB
MSSFLDKVFDQTVPGLAKAMDLSWRRHEAITSNIANAETPMYRAVDLKFEAELTKAFKAEKSSLAQTDPRHMNAAGSASAHLVSDQSGATRADGNNVDIDIQMGRLAYNSSQYSIASNLMRKKLGVLRRLISDAAR